MSRGDDELERLRALTWALQSRLDRAEGIIEGLRRENLRMKVNTAENRVRISKLAADLASLGG